jgi:hypothetical protein
LNPASAFVSQLQLVNFYVEPGPGTHTEVNVVVNVVVDNVVVDEFVDDADVVTVVGLLVVLSCAVVKADTGCYLQLQPTPNTIQGEEGPSTGEQRKY